MRKFWPLLMVVILLLGSSYPRDIYVDERTSTEIHFTLQDQMFPKHWYNAKINAEAEPLAPSERQRFIAILNRCFAKYPEKVLRENLDRVYGLKRMKFYGVAFGGTNIRNTVFICDDETDSSFTDGYIEGVFHHEFSSLLKRAFPKYLDTEIWEAANSPAFIYGNGGVDAIMNGEASMELDPEYYDKGLLTKYSQASVEEDINVFAQNLFAGSQDFWEIVEDNIRIQRKAYLLIAFYQKIDPRFNEEYFRQLPYRVARR
ncbi:MAG: hypothetical protein WCK84_06935 [Bacteroidota bacterium]